MFEAEARLLDTGQRTAAQRLPATVAAEANSPLPGRTVVLSVDQALGLEQIAACGRVLDLIVGPGLPGKSTTIGAVCVPCGRPSTAAARLSDSPRCADSRGLAR
jgi:hypothetical protein